MFVHRIDRPLESRVAKALQFRSSEHAVPTVTVLMAYGTNSVIDRGRRSADRRTEYIIVSPHCQIAPILSVGHVEEADHT